MNHTTRATELESEWSYQVEGLVSWKLEPTIMLLLSKSHYPWLATIYF